LSSGETTLIMPGQPPTRRRSSARTVVIVVLAVVVVLGLAIGADYAARAWADAEVAQRLQPELGTPELPTVDVGSFPFLVQALGGNVSSVRVQADDVGTANDQELQLRRLDVTATGVHSDDRFQTSIADHVAGTAQIDLTALSERVGEKVSSAGGGKVSFTRSTDVLGRTVDVVVTGRPHLDATMQTLTLADPSVEVANISLPQTLVDLLIRTLVKPVDITGIPLGLKLTSLAVDDSGLTAQVAGDNVALTS
jgi:hypothetical protein